jgi:NAD(P)H-dependent FMN reductase
MTDADAIRVLAIACSPRAGGNTDALLDAAIAGATEAGARVERFVLREMTISPCAACGACASGSGRCIMEDDMQRLYEPLVRADRIIIASPVFFMCLPAQAKAMIDRCQPLWLRRNRGETVSEARHSRAALYIGVGGGDLPHLFDASRMVLKSWYWTLQVFERRELTFSAIDDRGAILEHPTALADAREAGRSLAAWGRE